MKFHWIKEAEMLLQQSFVRVFYQATFDPVPERDTIASSSFSRGHLVCMFSVPASKHQHLSTSRSTRSASLVLGGSVFATLLLLLLAMPALLALLTGLRVRISDHLRDHLSGLALEICLCCPIVSLDPKK